MNYVLLIIFMGLQTIGAVSAAKAETDNEAKIMFGAKIYKVSDKDPTSPGASKVLESSPLLMAKPGVEASLKIGLTSESNTQEESIRLVLVSNAAATHFDVQLELHNGDNKTISSFDDSPIGKPLNFSAKLNNETRLISLHAVVVNDDSCGRVSTFRKPPKNQRFFPVTLYRIDDDNVDIVKTTHRLTPGKHTISINANTGNKRLIRGKGLELIIEPNKTYYIGAKLVEEKRYTQEDNWEPVIWRTVDEECSL